MKARLLFILGTRPEIVKLAPVIRLAKERPEFSTFLLHTGQHRELAADMLRVFELTPDQDLAVMQPDQNLFTLSARILEGLHTLFQKEKFDLILVQGDTTTVFLGALAGYYTKTPVAHVEAGLRTADRFSPYPEEMNRRLAGTLADLHFPPTAAAGANLVQEGIAPEHVVVTGNTVIDALLWAQQKPHTPQTPELCDFFRDPRPYLLVTTHRRESFGEPHRRIFAALSDILQRFPDHRLLFPVHPNPQVRREVGDMLGNRERVLLCPPCDYLDFLKAMAGCRLILSDSGGVQEEAPSLRKPVLVLRDKTERPEGLASGALLLVGTDRTRIVTETTRLLSDTAAYQAMTNRPNPYGDGRAAARILAAVARFLGCPYSGEDPGPFNHAHNKN